MSSAQNQFSQSRRSPSSAPSSPSPQDLDSEPASSADTSVDPNLPPMISSVPSPSAERTSSTLDAMSSAPSSALRQQPIPPASEPMQYRAIGLVQGKYEASPEQFTRGQILAADGTAIDAVLLGRVMSLVRKHLDLEQNHLWVVYPRTRDKSDNLHMQVVGVWEPEKLAPIDSDGSEPELPADSTQDGYFSIRGEVLFYSAEEQRLIVKIQQLPRPGTEQGRMFKLNLNGVLPGNKSIGYFWDLHVERQENNLVVREGTVIGLVPPKKRKPGEYSDQDRRRSPARRPGGASRPQRSSDRPYTESIRESKERPAATTPPVRREPIAKPVKRPKEGSA